MKTSSNNLFSQSGLDDIEEFFRDHNIPFQRKNDQAIEVSSFGDEVPKVYMTIYFKDICGRFRIDVSGGITVQDSRLNELQLYLNHVNFCQSIGSIFYWPSSKTITFRVSAWLSADEISDEYLDGMLSVASRCYRIYAQRCQEIINGGTLEDAVRLLSSANGTDITDEGGV